MATTPQERKAARKAARLASRKAQRQAANQAAAAERIYNRKKASAEATANRKNARVLNRLNERAQSKGQAPREDLATWGRPNHEWASYIDLLPPHNEGLA